MSSLLIKACHMVLDDECTVGELNDMKIDLEEVGKKLPRKLEAKEILWGELKDIAIKCSYPKLLEILIDNLHDPGLYEFIQDCTMNHVRHSFIAAWIDPDKDFLELCKTCRYKRVLPGQGAYLWSGSTERNQYLQEVIKAAKVLGIPSGKIGRFKYWIK